MVRTRSLKNRSRRNRRQSAGGLEKRCRRAYAGLIRGDESAPQSIDDMNGAIELDNWEDVKDKVEKEKAAEAKGGKKSRRSRRQSRRSNKNRRQSRRNRRQSRRR